MDDARTAHGAAALGALGAVLLLTGRTRSPLLAGYASLGLSQLGLALSLAGGIGWQRRTGDRRGSGSPGSPWSARCGGARRAGPRSRCPLVLVAAPFRLPLDFDRSHRFFVAVAESGRARAGCCRSTCPHGRGARARRGARCAARTPAPLPPWLAVPGRRVPRVRVAVAVWSDAGADHRHEPARLLPLPVRGRSSRSRRARRSPRGCRACWRRSASRLGRLFAGIGLGQGGDGDGPVLLAAARGLEHVQLVLPGHIAVPRPEPVRPPRRRSRSRSLLVGVWLRRIPVLLAAALIACLWRGLYFSYSQSSLVALFAVTLCDRAAAGDRTGAARRTRDRGRCSSPARPRSLATELRDQSAQPGHERPLTPGRADARRRPRPPVAGVGIGSQPPRAQRPLEPRRPPDASFVSHTTPLTVAAELGIVGLALYLALLAGAVRRSGRVWRRDAALGLALGAVLSRSSCTRSSTAASSRTRSRGSRSGSPRRARRCRSPRESRSRSRCRHELAAAMSGRLDAARCWRCSASSARSSSLVVPDARLATLAVPAGARRTARAARPARPRGRTATGTSASSARRRSSPACSSRCGGARRLARGAAGAAGALAALAAS